jgi:hypothetical protein
MTNRNTLSMQAFCYGHAPKSVRVRPLRLTVVADKHNVTPHLQKTGVEVSSSETCRTDLTICSGFFMPMLYGGGRLGSFMLAVFLYARSTNPVYPCHLYFSLVAVTGGLSIHTGTPQ